MHGENFILTTLCVFAVSSAEGRQKRVINGIIIRDRLYSYDAIKYFVWIGHGRDFWARLPYLSEEWDSQRVSCGGALLTLNIVQTACHCLARFELPERDGFRRAVKKSGTKVVMVGESEVDKGLSPFPVRYQEIHPLCGVLQGWLVYDFGVLVTRYEFRESARVTSAPVYPVADMAEMWSRFTTNLNVCLLMGFGRYISPPHTAVSSVLRHGWQSIISHHECYLIHTREGLKLSMSDYLDSVPVSCYQPLNTRIVTPGRGDSGSPVTCDGKYVGVHSHSNTTHGIMMDLVYYAYANSQEFRFNFLKEMINSDPHKKELPTFIPQSHAPDSAPPHFFASVNKAAVHATAIFLPNVLPILFVATLLPQFK